MWPEAKAIWLAQETTVNGAEAGVVVLQMC